MSPSNAWKSREDTWTIHTTGHSRCSLGASPRIHGSECHKGILPAGGARGG